MASTVHHRPEFILTLLQLCCGNALKPLGQMVGGASKPVPIGPMLLSCGRDWQRGLFEFLSTIAYGVAKQHW